MNATSVGILVAVDVLGGMIQQLQADLDVAEREIAELRAALNARVLEERDA